MRKILFLLFFVSSVVGRAAEMADTAAMLDEVVVTGSNAALPPRLLPYTVSVITRDRLDATGSTQLLSAISGQVPSLFEFGYVRGHLQDLGELLCSRD